MTAKSSTNQYAEWFEQLRAEYSDQLNAMELPAGLPEHLHQLVVKGDEEAIKFMLKLAWQFGAQVGYAAGSRHEGEATTIATRKNVQA